MPVLRLAAMLLIAAALLTACAGPSVDTSWYRTPDPTGTAFYKGIGPAGGSGVEARW